jgi:hypothetical protein
LGGGGAVNAGPPPHPDFVSWAKLGAGR